MADTPYFRKSGRERYNSAVSWVQKRRQDGLYDERDEEKVMSNLRRKYGIHEETQYERPTEAPRERTEGRRKKHKKRIYRPDSPRFNLGGFMGAMARMR
jgi:hypothetical protein